MLFEVALERVIAAPRTKVYRAWLDPALVARWFGPDDMSVVDATVDERVGGEHTVELLGPDGVLTTFASVIEDLVPDELIVLTFKFDRTAQETRLSITFERRRRRRDLAAPSSRADRRRGSDRHSIGQCRLEPDAGQVADLSRKLIPTPTTTPTTTRRTIMNHPTGTQSEWDTARRSLLVREKELTRMSDALAKQRLAAAVGARRRGVRVRHRGRSEEPRRSVRRTLAADHLPLHVRARVGTRAARVVRRSPTTWIFHESISSITTSPGWPSREPRSRS